MQVETPEVGAEQATTPTFKPGDKVTFTEIRRGAKSIRLTSKEATVVRILATSQAGDAMTCTYSSGDSSLLWPCAVHAQKGSQNCPGELLVVDSGSPSL